MKDTFKEFARLKPDELKALWAEAIIVFDTNILLNLYEYSQNTRDGVFEIMEQLQKQLWLPYKVGEEFYTKRISKIHTHNNSCSKIVESIDNLLKIDKESCLYELLHDNEHLKKLKRDVDKISKQDMLNTYDDPIVEKIEKIYDGNVGHEPKPAEIDEIEKEYLYKTANGIYCPGFKDNSKEKNSSGDFHLWKQILNYGVKNNKSIIFVTEDGKEDWWWKPQGVRISARYELIKEFIHSTNGKKFHMYKFKDFTEAYKKYKGGKVDKKVTEEIKNAEKEKSATMNILAQVLAGNKSEKESVSNWTKFIDTWKGLKEYQETINSYEQAIKPLKNMQEQYEKMFEPLKKTQFLMNPWDKYKSVLDKQSEMFENSLEKMLKSCSPIKDTELICRPLKDEE